MNLPRNQRGRVELVDTAEGSYGRVIEVGAVTAREIMRNPKSTRYVPVSKFDEMKRKKELDDAVEAEISRRAGAKPKAAKTEVVAQDIIDAHDAVKAENVDGDDRLTKTGLVKEAIIKELTGREITKAEFLAYMRHIKAQKTE